MNDRLIVMVWLALLACVSIARAEMSDAPAAPAQQHVALK
jgi:hypothetical protein